MTDYAAEYQFDGLISPSHHFGGLSPGNLASMQHGGQVSRPRAACRQGLRKMRRLVELGVPQGFFPPRECPRLNVLRDEGFSGSDIQVLERAARQAPELFRACFSASSMWAANAATVSPAADTADGRCHLTPANLYTQLHRRLEAAETPAILDRIFSDPQHFVRHDPLPSRPDTADEGAANHLRLSPSIGAAGLEVFVFGRDASGSLQPERHPARQTRAAAEATARQHGLAEARTVFVQQNPAAIDAGVFHNDVIAVSHENLLLVHAGAWVDQSVVLDALRAAYARLGAGPLEVIEIPDNELPLNAAVRTYFFNSQIVRGRKDERIILAPRQCEEHDASRRLIERLCAPAGPLDAVLYVDLDESMANGGGPACLRLRCELTPDQAAAVHPGFLLDAARLDALDAWASRYYRETLTTHDLLDPQLIREIRTALDELTRLCGLGSIYSFQR